MSKNSPAFAKNVLNWFTVHGRHDLPWQQEVNPYRVWVSEVMLQQTQVATVIPYFTRFMQQFPDVHALAAAPIDQVLHLWTGLGYYARARNMHRSAQIISSDHQGEFPQSVAALSELPGIGRSTAGAILSLGMSRHAAILDGNVKRVLCRHHAIAGWPEQSAVRRQLWELAENLTPSQRCGQYNQAMMDLGATVCTRSKPQCGLCPLNKSCQAYNTDSTALYPEKKPSKKLPVKSTHMLLCLHEGRVLLQQRPASGLWGGLWCLPECESRQQLEAFCAKISRYTTQDPIQCGAAHHEAGNSQLQISHWQSLRHTFSHFHLDISPVQITLPAASQQLQDSAGQLWYPLDHSVAVGLAAPVKKLLDRLAATLA